MPVFLRVSRALCLLYGLTAMLAAVVPVFGQVPVPRLASLPSAAEQRVALPMSVSPRAARAQSLGHLSGDTVLTHMSLVLQPTTEQDAALTQLLQDQQNPASPSYHRWLTPEQFGERFGLSGGDLQIVQAWLQTHGLTVESMAASRNNITFSGTAGAAEDAFGVTLERFRRNGREFYENTGSIRVPASLAGVVSGVGGLSSYRLAAPQVKRAPASRGIATPMYTTSTGTHYLVPWDFRQIYGMNTLLGSGYDGTGITIGVIGQSAVDTAQLTYFQQKTGQPVRMPTMVLVPNTSASARVTGDEAESELDLEYAAANAPGAAIQFIYTGCANAVTGNCNNNGVYDAAGYAITHNLAQVLAFSYGGCEAEDAAYALSTLEPLLRQANAQGQTIVASSGDGGAASCEQSITAASASEGLAVSYPASSVYATAVGGTQLNTDSSTYWSSGNNAGTLGSAAGYMPEIAWNDTSSYGSLTASGGGVSKLFSKPAWQMGSGVPSDGYRDVPDIAFAANVSEHAYLICDSDDPCLSGGNSFVVGRDGGAVGGTSAAVPNFAAMLAIIAQANGGHALGNINQSLYGLATSTTASAIFHDITAGNNMVPCVVGSVDCTNGVLGYSAAAGYDLVTGLGSISGAALQPALATYAATTPTISMATSPTAPVVGVPVTFTVTLSGSSSTPTGLVTFSVDGVAAGPAVAASSGTASYAYSGFGTSGTHTISALYTGDGTYHAGSASRTVTVLPNTPVLAVTASPPVPVTGAAVTFTAALSGSAGVPAGTVNFFVDNVPGPTGVVPVRSGTATLSYAGFSSAGVHTVTATYSGSAIYGTVSSPLVVIVRSPTQTVTPTVRLTVLPTATSVGSPLTLMITVGGNGPLPTGTVSYTIDGNAGSSGALASGAASFTYAGFASAGTYSVVTNYSGDATYTAGSASATVTVTAPGIGLSLNSGTLTMAAGGNGTITAMVASQNGFSGAVGFRLAMVSSAGAAFGGCYALSPATVMPSAGASASTTVTMLSSSSGCTGGNGTLLARDAGRTFGQGNGAPKIPRGGLVIVTAGLLGWFGVRRRVSIQTALAILICGLACCLQGCGSGISSNAPTTVTTPASPTASAKGTYVIQVTAAAVANPAVTSSAQFTLSVQ